MLFENKFLLFLSFTIILHYISSSNTNSECEKGYFKLLGMKDCHSWLSCKDLAKLEIQELVGYGAVKQVYKTIWRNYTCALAFVNNEAFTDDFQHGLNMLIELSPSEHVSQLIGFCKESNVYLTHYYPYGDANNVHNILKDQNNYDIKIRFELCISYIRILLFLHNSPIGRLVMCDSSSLSKTLSQYLITSKLQLVVSDVDSLSPPLTSEGIVCGHRELRGTFVAPEQLWPWPGEEFWEEKMPPYTEKVDIWKIPNVCSYFLGKNTEAQKLKNYILNINNRCHSHNPSMRPSAEEVLESYKEAFQIYSDQYYKKNEL